MSDLIVRDDGKYKKYEELLLRRDQLYKEAGSIHVSYVKEFGDLLIQDFEIKVECIKKRKMIAYCIGAVNHGQAIDVQDMNRKIEHEMASFNEHLKQMAEEKDIADKSKVSPSYKVEKAKRIYRRLAKLIHPDINPVAAKNEQIRELWERIVISYHCNDDVELDNLEILVRKALKDNGSLVENIEIDDIEERISRIEEEINTIIVTEPYKWSEILSSPEKISAKKQDITREIEAGKKISEELSKILQDIISGGGVPITWIQE